MEKLKQEKGSITLFVVISMLFFVLFLTGVYMLSSLGEQRGISETAKIKEIYEKDLNQIGDVYETLANVQNVNIPNFKETGLTPITISEDGTITEADTTKNDWYSYDGQKNQWANAKTKDGSIFVWIPRFAYKINYKDTNNKAQGGTIDIVFLKDTTNLDFKGNDVTKQDYIDKNGVTGAYIVHPAFKDGRNNRYANGEWNEEITGFWMAKFEAGYEDSNKAIDSNVEFSTIMSYDGSTTIDKTDSYYGTRQIGTLIKYPVFKANRPSMNYIGISDAYRLCRTMNSDNNPYGLTSKADSHLTKNSEWGAIAYLTHSKYGRNGEEVTINNITLGGTDTIYAVTGYGAATIGGPAITTSISAIQNGTQTGSWTTLQGQKASTTNNIYGIYDLSGGLWEWAAGYIAAGDNYTAYGGNLKGENNKYRSKYEGISQTNTENYKEDQNTKRIGEAIWETSISGTGKTSWNGDISYFSYTVEPFFIRGGSWGITAAAGTFAFISAPGCCYYNIGFRPVIIIK